MKTVTITFLGVNDKENHGDSVTSTFDTDCENSAINLIARKHFGENAGFFAENGFYGNGVFYGQIADQRGVVSTMYTELVRVDVE